MLYIIRLIASNFIFNNIGIFTVLKDIIIVL